MDEQVVTSAAATDLSLNSMETNSETSIDPTGLDAEGSRKSARVDIMRDAIRKSLKKMLTSGKYKYFADAYSAHSKHNPKRLQNVHGMFIEELQKKVLDDVEILIKDEGIEELLGKLDTLEKAAATAAAARSGKSMWRPSKEPAEDFQAHALPYKRQEWQKLQLEVRDMERNAKELASTVVQSREHIQQLKKQLDVRQQHWENLHSLNKDVAELEK